LSIVVQKFGGTSVNTPEKREKVLDKIIAAKEKGHDVVVVVSAMGRKGEPYATDTLLDLLVQVGSEPAKNTKDLLASCGEIITTCIMAQAVEQRGYKALPMTGFQAGIITDDNFTNAEVIRVETANIKNKLNQGYIVIVAGFQGITERMEITTLGRGGSDTTALALGGALGAAEVIIYTDVPGVAFTDPRLIPTAPFLKAIGFSPMYTLARAGAKVIHLRAVKAAINFSCPFYIRSTFTEDLGTLVGQPGESFNGIFGLAVCKDMSLVRLQKIWPRDQVKKLAVDELFYKEDSAECWLAVQGDPCATQLGEYQCLVTKNLALITIAWDEGNQLTIGEISQLLQKQGIQIAESFEFPGGGSWLIPEEQNVKALQALYDYALGRQ